jgi:diaminopimelate epimerase
LACGINKDMSLHPINFEKMHGLGNDFVIIDIRENPVPDLPTIRAMADRRHGIGCDQLILLYPSETADIKMVIYNSDGSESGACGNATRCVARMVCDELKRDNVSIETAAGILLCEQQGELICVNMGKPKTVQSPVDVQGLIGTVIDVGNPHYVMMVEDINKIDIATIGASLEIDSAFPNRSNIEFVQILSPENVRMRVWERGVGITQACGSGACATGIAVITAGLCESPVTVAMDGGDLLISYNPVGDGCVYMTGPTAHVFSGTYKDI